MKYELIVDNEWIFEGDYDTVCEMADTYAMDEDSWCGHDIRIMTEAEFYGEDYESSEWNIDVHTYL